MRAIAAATAAAAVLAGCAGDADERLSRAEFVERATAICERAEERLRALDEPGSVAELEAYARDAGEITGTGVSDLRELEPPEQLEDGFERYLAAGEDVVALLDELQRAAAGGDEAQAREIAGRIGDRADAQAAARAAGIPACEADGGE
jgi:hypothetical protein